ncbi:MAG TPA: diaminobutyrate acetyltransferase, partial [Arthrobacter bacterium]|nr:diaminobutyrate acetyltransferase [Arthrobacter sp.]
MARDSKVLDLNSSYSYLLWCRDFAAASIMATVDGEPAGFITGYMRPGEPGTLMVWQVAVDEAFRGRKLAASML